MPAVTFQVLEGIDKGRIFREMNTPVTIGREEGNVLRLNDERVSRYHAKILCDNQEIIITDLDSTNGTRVNENPVQIRRLQIGDRIRLGKSLLLFGSDAEIRARMETQLSNQRVKDLDPGTMADPGTMSRPIVMGMLEEFYIGGQCLPPLPHQLGPSNAARLTETLEFLHKYLVAATENIRPNEDSTQVTLSYNDWQRILGIQMVLARYIRAISEPDSLEE